MESTGALDSHFYLGKCIKVTVCICFCKNILIIAYILPLFFAFTMYRLQNCNIVWFLWKCLKSKHSGQIFLVFLHIEQSYAKFLCSGMQCWLRVKCTGISKQSWWLSTVKYTPTVCLSLNVHANILYLYSIPCTLVSTQARVQKEHSSQTCSFVKLSLIKTVQLIHWPWALWGEGGTLNTH